VTTAPDRLRASAARRSRPARAAGGGTEVELTATPGKGTTSLEWSVGAGTCTGSTNPCKVTMSAAKSLTAKFE
jgi:hypothetical protein